MFSSTAIAHSTTTANLSAETDRLHIHIWLNLPDESTQFDQWLSVMLEPTMSNIRQAVSPVDLNHIKECTVIETIMDFDKFWQIIWLLLQLLKSLVTQHTTTTILRPFVRDYLGEPVPEETLTNHPDHHPIFISFFHLPRFITSSLFKLHAWQAFCTTSLQKNVFISL